MIVAFPIRVFSMGCLLVGAAVCAPVFQEDAGNSTGSSLPRSSPGILQQKQTEKPGRNVITQKPAHPRDLKHGNGIFGLAKNSKSPRLSSQYVKPSSGSSNALLSHKNAKLLKAGQSHSEFNAQVKEFADNCDSGDSSECYTDSGWIGCNDSSGCELDPETGKGVSCSDPSGCRTGTDDNGGVSCSDPSGCELDPETGSGVSCSDPSGCELDPETGNGVSCSEPSGCRTGTENNGGVSCSDPSGCELDPETGSGVSCNDPSGCSTDTENDEGVSCSDPSGCNLDPDNGCNDPSGCRTGTDDNGGVSCSDPSGCPTEIENDDGISCKDPSGCSTDTDDNGGVSCSDPSRCVTDVDTESGGPVSFESDDPSSCGKDTDDSSSGNESTGNDGGSREHHPHSGAAGCRGTIGPRKSPFSKRSSKYNRIKYVFSQMRYTPGEFKSRFGHYPYFVYWRH